MKPVINSSSILMLLFALLSLCSCGDLQQDLYLKSDGSGTLETSFDIGELLGMAKGLEDMGSDQDTFSDDHVVEPVTPAPVDSSKDQVTLLIEKITDPAHDKDVDTVLSLLYIMPDSIRKQQTDLSLVEKMFVRLKSPANSGDLTLGIIMNFNSDAQLREMIRYLQTIDQGSGIMSGTESPFGKEGESFLAFETDMKAGIIKIDTIRYSDFSVQMGMSQDSIMGEEDLAMMEMMFGNSKIRSVIHVPGEVLSCSLPDALLTKDNRVIVEHSFMDVIRNGKIDGYTILFKP